MLKRKQKASMAAGTLFSYGYMKLQFLMFVWGVNEDLMAGDKRSPFKLLCYKKVAFLTLMDTQLK